MDGAAFELSAPRRGWRYHSGTAIYTERFSGGRLIAASLTDTGTPCYAENEETDTPSFLLDIDGNSCSFGWELAESAVAADPPGARVALAHTIVPVRIEIATSAGGGFFSRAMRLTNVSRDRTVGISAFSPLAGALWPMSDALAENLAESGASPYRLGWMRDVEWGNEGNFGWNDLPANVELAIGSSRGRSGFSTPFAVLENRVYGGCCILSLAWSANWTMRVRSEQSRGGSSKLVFSLGPTAPAPMRLVAPGETVELPVVRFGLNHEGFDAAVRGWHRHLRAHVLRTVGDGKQPLIYNHWGYMQHEMSEDALKREIDIAAAVGAELFMVDAGWYADAQTKWYETTGDWTTGDRLPNDLFPVFAYARSKGMKCGLWVEIESAAKQSELAAAHPDWFISRYGAPVDRILDLAKPEVAAYVEETIVRLVERYRLEMFRLDYNLDAREGGFNLRAGRMENTLWRHVETMHAVFDRVGRRFPDLQLENCSSGGGRTDLGMVSRFTTTWVSDWMKMPRTVRILNGMSLALPPEYLDRLFGMCMAGSSRGNPETQMHAVILAHPTLSGITPALAEANPALLGIVKKYAGIYKNFVRPFHRTAAVYHHTPVIPGPDGSGWCALEYVSEDRRRMVAGAFRLVNAPEEYVLRFRGVDPGLRYRITAEPDSLTWETDGASLSREGVPVRLDMPLTSRLFLAEAV